MKSSSITTFLYKKNRLQQIKGFYYTARFKSISKAAKALNLTQSTITLQVQSLERDLKLKLLNRDSKPLTLTQEGEEFYEIACPLMHEFESIIEEFLSKKKQKEYNKIDIAMHHVTISFLMPHITAIFRKSYPWVKIFLRNIPRG
jgi:DNA-binding transcriptional LysR family regulator